ncbi:uncharacterized protein LOC126737727 [Anthonomus grandis grandis]|uniref:uncharacterized protein LOC126737727 n=1 Tax=Anthonomus grandis grandis TaxID=2921223 RepID=UPI002166A817|nr:uncharacterized protein LOC126737727 [Anthonomus grandis grandis]XP_050298695.1 uncharacterized protein LOC126737727 [Anthonomus grandis grandis]XP_050298696.1 uncharacterized protein LOC126737727 [Anthonomus grandis grandis]
MAGEPNGSTEESNVTISSTTPLPPYPTVDPKEYYKTYDVMTGVRIAATLGSFFGLMVLLVLYKSKSKTEKALEDPNFTAAAVAEAEEEERQIQLALEATALEELNPGVSRLSRKSLDSSHGRRASRRFSLAEGHSSLYEPSTKLTSRLPSFVDEDSSPDDAASLYDDIYYNSKLLDPRRPSNITCSSSGSSYLERRDSAVTLGFSVLPPHKYNKSSRRQSSPVPEMYDLYYPIDIHVTHPTPGGSPCGSDRALYQAVGEPPNLKPRLAPLASISSCNSSLGTDYFEDYDAISYACDTYPDEEENTENGVDPFDTDSDVNSEDGACYDKRTKVCVVSNDSSSTISNGGSRYSTEHPHPCNSKTDLSRESRSSSTLFECCQLPQITFAEVHRLASSTTEIDRKNSWTQETLF